VTTGESLNKPLHTEFEPRMAAWLRARSIVAWVVFVIGLVAPLTPSHGPPSLRDYAIYAGFPVLLLVWCVMDCRSRGGQALFGAQALIIAAFAGVLALHLLYVL
jgi:hypothetical protein